MDQDRIIYIVVDRVGAPYRVLLYQPGIRFSLGTNRFQVYNIKLQREPKSIAHNYLVYDSSQERI